LTKPSSETLLEVSALTTSAGNTKMMAERPFVGQAVISA
jgi:hypothetical protein